ncbi:hypothetical protein GSI_06568 [Ganoderma sinense ZZ0214-1]|uniref:Uncharacterized protein n=1 Tax=Ganoderma sinense ZZ0214-1 TaxID=1077348 RepID=A0A2G8SDL0_9APHY|nr:hypothetical protein GSI_06568 [Ganoderma sinense ZZ0214-1]
MDEAKDVVEKYKKHPFAKGLLPFRPSIKVLDTPQYAKIFAKQEGRQRWVICNKATGGPALFSHAGLIAQADNMETGNFVPSDEEIPAGIEEKNVQRRANSKCFYTYVLDTYGDLSLYEDQWTLDEYMSSLDAFNPGSLPRRQFLSGQDAKYRARFWLQTPMFLRKGPNDDNSDAMPHLHPWVLKAAKESKGFKGNPDRPRIWVKEGKKVTTIGERDPGYLVRGDVVAFSFTVTYHITGTNWFPQFHPADIVVMKTGTGDPTDYSAPEIGLYNLPPPCMDEVDDDEGGSKGRNDGSGNVQAEKVVESHESVPMDEVDADSRSSGTMGSPEVEGRQEVEDGIDQFAKPGEGLEDLTGSFVDVSAQEAEASGSRGSGKTGRARRRA